MPSEGPRELSRKPANSPVPTQWNDRGNLDQVHSRCCVSLRWKCNAVTPLSWRVLQSTRNLLFKKNKTKFLDLREVIQITFRKATNPPEHPKGTEIDTCLHHRLLEMHSALEQDLTPLLNIFFFPFKNTWYFLKASVSFILVKISQTRLERQKEAGWIKERDFSFFF